MNNNIAPRTNRLGWLIDGDADTPHVAALLADDGEAVSITIPWRDRDSPYRYWFSIDSQFGDDPERKKRTYEVPEILWFQDVRGSVALVGCRPWRGSLGSPGEGVAHVAIAVLGGGPMIDYRTIHGLRSELPGLSDWMSIRGMREEFETDEEGKLQSLSLHVRAPEAIRITQALNTKIKPSFSFQRASKADTSTIHESLLIETRTKDPRDWMDHLSAHNSLRDIVNVAGWSQFGYAKQWAIRDDDPLTALSGDILGEKWSELRTYATPSHIATSGPPRFLFHFKHIGTKGLRRWSYLRKHYQRGLTPILSLLDQKNAWGATALTQLGIGLDGLGYQRALDQNLSKRAARSETHEQRLLRIVADLAVPLPFDSDAWAERSANAYNGVKHANRDLPDRDELAITMGQNRLVFRLWVASQLGVTESILQANMRIDPAATH